VAVGLAALIMHEAQAEIDLEQLKDVGVILDLD